MKWFTKVWAFFGGIAALVILFVVFFTSGSSDYFTKLLWLHLAIILLHQFEEYAFPGNFKQFYNLYILNSNQFTRFPLNEKSIIIINILIAWPAYLLSAMYPKEILWLALGLAGVSLTNGLAHSYMFWKLKKYNPGLFTAILLFIPYSFYLLYHLSLISPKGHFAIGGLITVLSILCIPLTIRLSNY